MKRHKVKYFIFGIIIILIVLFVLKVILWPRIVESKARQDMDNAMRTTITLLKPELIFDSVGPIFVDCYGVMFAETVCKSEAQFGTSEEDIKIRRGITLKDIENYIFETSAILEKHGWLPSDRDSFATGVLPSGPVPDYPMRRGADLDYSYFKRFGSVHCVVSFGYSPIDSVSGTLDVSYFIGCKKVFSDLFGD